LPPERATPMAMIIGATGCARGCSTISASSSPKPCSASAATKRIIGRWFAMPCCSVSVTVTGGASARPLLLHSVTSFRPCRTRKTYLALFHGSEDGWRAIATGCRRGRDRQSLAVRGRAPGALARSLATALDPGFAIATAPRRTLLTAHRRRHVAGRARGIAADCGYRSYLRRWRPRPRLHQQGVRMPRHHRLARDAIGAADRR